MKRKMFLVGILFLLSINIGLICISESRAANIAIYGEATAIGHYSNNYPSKAIDGNWTTFWDIAAYGSQTNPLWWKVDLKAIYVIDKIVLVGPKTTKWPGYTNIYNLYTSTDGNNWNKIASGTLTDTYDYVHTIDPIPNISLRYAKYEVVGGSHWANLREMEIYPVPLPAGLILLGTGLLGLGVVRRFSLR